MNHQELWTAYRKDKSEYNFARLFNAYKYIIGGLIAKRWNRFRVDRDSFYSDGALGLQNAIESWDGTGDFTKWAVACIFRSINRFTFKKLKAKKRSAATTVQLDLKKINPSFHETDRAEIQDTLQHIFKNETDEVYKLMLYKFGYNMTWDEIINQGINMSKDKMRATVKRLIGD